MGQQTQSAINVTLTTYAKGVAQDLVSAVANFIAPVVRVGSPVGQFKKFDDKNAFQIYGTARGYGGSANRISFAATDGTLNCLPQALEIALDDAERAGGTDSLQMEQAKVRTLISATTIAHEKKVLDLMKSGKAATGGIGNWTAADADPIAEIDAMIETIANATGQMPNRILFGLAAMRIIRNNPKVMARFPGAASVGVSMDQLTGLFLNPQMQGKVAVLSRDTTKMGATASKTNIVGSEVFVFLGSDSPDIYDPSFAKTFTVGEGGVDKVRQYRDESARSDVFAIDWSEDIQVVSSISAVRATIS
jgi:hypothetical protein